ncbi:MAG: hypothetical protein QM791_03790 [Ferruginibacter sp.]
MIKSIFSFILVLLFTGICWGQNLSGTWTGSVRGTSFIKLELVHTGGSCFGYSLDSKSKTSSQVNVQAQFDHSEGTLKGSAVNLNDQFPENEVFIFNLQYKLNKGREFLIGIIAPGNTDEQLLSLNGLPFMLEKQNDTAVVRPKKEPKKKIEKPLPPPPPQQEKVKKDTVEKTVKQQPVESIEPAHNKNREVKIAKIISVKADTVKIILKDDGEVDGDIVTVLDNGKVIASHLALSAEPYEINLTLPPDNSMHILELVAENEGTVPPNTAYMLVLAGEKRVEVKTSSNKLTNAAIVIQKEE